MNQINQAEIFAKTAVGAAPTAGATADPRLVLNAADAVRPPPKPALPRLTDADARLLQAALLKGDDSVARRKDLGEMYKRIVAMIATLDTGLNDRQDARAAASAAALASRLEAMERSVNAVEGVLRIEMEPIVNAAIRASIGDAMAQARVWPRITFGGRLLQLVVICGAVALGAIFSGQISDLGQRAKHIVSGIELGATATLSPIGGIAPQPNHIN